MADTHPLVGQHRHVLMIQLQAELYKRTKVWMPFEDLWDKVGEMFDLDRLDNMVCLSSTSVPSSTHIRWSTS